MARFALPAYKHKKTPPFCSGKGGRQVPKRRDGYGKSCSPVSASITLMAAMGHCSAASMIISSVSPSTSAGMAWRSSLSVSALVAIEMHIWLPTHRLWSTDTLIFLAMSSPSIAGCSCRQPRGKSLPPCRPTRTRWPHSISGPITRSTGGTLPVQLTTPSATIHSPLRGRVRVVVKFSPHNTASRQKTLPKNRVQWPKPPEGATP